MSVGRGSSDLYAQAVLPVPAPVLTQFTVVASAQNVGYYGISGEDDHDTQGAENREYTGNYRQTGRYISIKGTNMHPYGHMGQKFAN